LRGGEAFASGEDPGRMGVALRQRCTPARRLLVSVEATAGVPRHPPADPAAPRVLAKGAGGWARAWFDRPSRVAGTLEVTAAGALVSVLPLQAWEASTFAILVAAAGTAIGFAALRFAVGERLPAWSLNVDVAVGNVLLTLATAASTREHADLANLYLLLGVFAFLYLPFRAAIAHLGAAGAAYGVVLATAQGSAEPAPLAWLSVFGTAGVLCAVVTGLVGVLRKSAREDHLTGLANRRHWEERLDEELERARRSQAPLSVLVADLDGFKEVNDTLGHHGGDNLLRDVAARWSTIVRASSDLLARLGGDEFALLLPGTDERGSHGLARRLAEALPGGIRASFGTATWDRAESASELVRRADLALYRAKRGR
jgi:diguanylate cyclase (GGDEF)-like protein